MPFSEKIKKIALEKALFRCCICKDLASDIHHIIPQENDGPDTLENAAPLCASCHDYFGDNPDKQRKIKALRNNWWKLVEMKYKYVNASDELFIIEGIEVILDRKITMKDNSSVMISHNMLPHDNFYITAYHIFDLLKKTQKDHPFRSRIFSLSVEGHRNSKGGFDKDAIEIIQEFCYTFIFPYITEYINPFHHVENPYPQINNLPEKLFIGDSLKDRYENRFNKKPKG